MVGSNVMITYCDGSRWEVNVSEISDRYYKVCYEMIDAEPYVKVSSVQTEIELYPCTFDNSTFIKWTTEYANDADAVVI